MAKVCEVCGKGKMSGNIVTHSDRKIKRTWKPNLRKIKVAESGATKKINVCTNCMKSNKIVRAI